MASSSNGRGWQTGKPLSECVERMLDDEIATDVNIIIKSPVEGEPDIKIAAHKFMLCARSPVFEAMFSGSYLESKGEVLINDAEPGSFRDMLRYIYTDKVSLTGTNVVQVLNLARKYLLDGLVAECMEFVDNLSSGDVCETLSNSVMLEEEELVVKCLRVCDKATADVIESAAFLELTQPALLRILKHDWLDFQQEEALFKACIRWAERKKKTEMVHGDIRDILGECLYQIRFFQFKPKRFVTLLRSVPVLTATEKNWFLSYAVTEEVMYSRLARDAGFNPTSRILTFTKCAEVVTISDRSNAEDKETFTLFVKKAAILYGVSVLAKFRDVPHNININIYEKLDSEIIKIGYTNKGITSVRKSSVFAQFNRNIQLLPGSSYLITAVPPKDSNLCSEVIIDPLLGRGSSVFDCTPKHAFNRQNVNYQACYVDNIYFLQDFCEAK